MDYYLFGSLPLLLDSSNFVYIYVCMKTELSVTEKVKIYKYKEIRQATDDFNVLNKIGEGGFGSVYKVNEKKDHLLTVLVLNSLFISLTLWGK